MGDFAARSLPPNNDYVKLRVMLANSTTIETINVPFISRLATGPFTSGADLWAKNCKATDSTNGKDLFASAGTSSADGVGDSGPEHVDPSPPKFAEPIAPEDRKHPISGFIDLTAFADVSLPPTLNPPPPVSGSGTAMFYMQGKVGVLALGSFSTGAGYNDWFTILSNGLNELKNQGATHLIVDVVSSLVFGDKVVPDIVHRQITVVDTFASLISSTASSLAQSPPLFLKRVSTPKPDTTPSPATSPQ
jgi:hypothetical protein